MDMIISMLWMIKNIYCWRPASARSVRRPVKADVRCPFSFIPSFRIVYLQHIPKSFTDFRYSIMVVVKKTKIIPFWRIAVAFTIFAILAYPKIGFLWINDLEAIRIIKGRIIPVRFWIRIWKNSICIGFDSKHLIDMAQWEGYDIPLGIPWFYGWYFHPDKPTNGISANWYRPLSNACPKKFRWFAAWSTNSFGQTVLAEPQGFSKFLPQDFTRCDGFKFFLSNSMRRRTFATFPQARSWWSIAGVHHAVWPLYPTNGSARAENRHWPFFCS